MTPSDKTMANLEEIEKLRVSLKEAELVQADLDRRVFHLKTLFDVSKDIYSSVESETIMRNFLLMAMGNFGVVEGFLILLDAPAGETSHFVTIGVNNSDTTSLKKDVAQLKLQNELLNWNEDGAVIHEDSLPFGIGFCLPFSVDPDCPGLLGLGPKLIKEPFTENDKELLDTLVNNLVVALKNASSF